MSRLKPVFPALIVVAVLWHPASTLRAIELKSAGATLTTPVDRWSAAGTSGGVCQDNDDRPKLLTAFDLDPDGYFESAVSTGYEGVVATAAERGQGGAPACPHCSQAAGSADRPTVAAAYRPLFYDNDFSVLEQLPDSPEFITDALKGVEFGPCVKVDVAGEYRLRHEFQNNMGLNLLNQLDDDFLLQRTRVYINTTYGSVFRAYAELIDATSAFEDLPARAIDENRTDFLNLFGDATLLDVGDQSLVARVGRQELLYGVERLVSPLDWANTRRTFDGAKLIWKTADWQLDGFWVRPVPFAQHVPDDHNFDNPDLSRDFIGAYATYHGLKDHTVDFYYLRLDEYDGLIADFDANTFGARWQGSCGSWRSDLEGGYQFGEFGPGEQSAGFCTIGLGHQCADLPGAPTLWAYFDWASGDADPADGDVGTFNQLFPLGHKYFGFMDLVARQNIQSWNFLLTSQPRDRVRLLLWWFIFHLDESRDALYNAAGVPIRVDPTGAAGTDVGQELDLLTQIAVSDRVALLFGYSHFFAGDFVRQTGSPSDADFYYSQCTLRF